MSKEHWFKLTLTEWPRTMTKREYKDTTQWLRTVRREIEAQLDYKEINDRAVARILGADNE